MSSSSSPAVRPRRKNGFSPPYTAAQISSWVALPIICLEFLFFISPILPLPVSVPCTVIFFVTAMGAVYYAVLTSAIDPSDVHLLRHLREEGCKSNPRWLTCFGIKELEPEQDDEDTKQCWICDIQVAEHAMHCKYCNKCVSHFDHHCLWLNTCVGKANYRYFFKTMFYIVAMMVVHGAISIALIVDIFVKGGTEERAEDWFDANTSEAVAAVLIFFAIFDLISIALIGQLLYFHIGLQRENLTTYKYILRDNQRKRDQAKVAAARAGKRMTAMAKAHEEGKALYALRLRMGGYLGRKCGPFCDPLPRDEEAGGPPTASRSNGECTLNGDHCSSQEGHTHSQLETDDDDHGEQKNEETAPRS